MLPTTGRDERERWQVIEEHFERIVELEPTERLRALDRACGDDKRLRAEIEALLRADGAAEGFLEQPVDEIAPTLMREVAQGPRSSPESSSSSDHGRFIPGTVLARRYRITGLLGRGGMGEVYRADDLKLGEPVALKFLPPGLETDGSLLERFLNEVRMALRVSHPNVCRVRDVGELEGQHFISMEFVDGEDLASLIRRIGRLPKDKAVQVARQLCAGLAAAHQQGVLHRDLKPANVMIDGRGQVKITDFGLAGVDDSIQGAEARVGTPAYMSPEQWEATEVTIKSDLYALGLVLYEVFTGEQPYRGKTAAEIRQLRRESSPPTPSSVMETIDPAVERVIVQCLEKEPSRRPASALAVSAALPGGDPLAEALAAGETPSPELVAQAGSDEEVSTGLAIGLFVAAVILVGFWVAVAGQAQLVGFVKSEKSPDVLVERARQIIRDVGYGEVPLDSLFDFAPNTDYLDHIRETDSSVDRWQALRQPQPAAMHFRYRQAPDYISKLDAGEVGNWMTDPPVDEPGEVMLVLDLEGRLLSFQAVPPERIEPGDPSGAEVDWEPLLAAAGLELAALTPQRSTWLPPNYADTRAAWTGFYPTAEEVEIRIEAAAFQGRPVAMRLLEPWSRAPSEEPERGRQTAALVMSLIWTLGMIGVALIIALRNLRLGRGDWKTALRCALYVGSLYLLGAMLGSHHVPSSSEETDLVFSHVASAAWVLGLTALWYLATEPYARKIWPHLLATWVRFVGDRGRGPLIGRDILVGLVLGPTLAVLWWSQAGVFAQLTGLPSAAPESYNLHALGGSAFLLSALLAAPIEAMLTLLTAVVFLVIVRLAVRKTWLAVLLVWMTLTFLNFADSSGSAVDALIQAVTVALFLFALFRFGFLTLAVALTVFVLFWTHIPMTYDMSSWYFSGTLIVVALFLGLAIYALRMSLAGRQLLRDELGEAGTSPAGASG